MAEQTMLKPCPFCGHAIVHAAIWESANGPSVYPAQVTFPRPEMTAGTLDPETGEYTEDPEPTGMWVCEVRLMEPCAALAEIA